MSTSSNSLQSMEPSPKMVDHYDRARRALTAALESTHVEVVLAGREELDHIKLRAKQINDRELLADAIEFQMRIERHLGTLLNAAYAAGQLYGPGRPKTLAQTIGGMKPATLTEIGVDRKLSMTARQAAALNEPAFDAAVSEMRAQMAGGKAKLVSATFGAQKTKRHAAPHVHSSFDFVLSDGTPLGQIRLGKLRDRIERLRVELKILMAISDRIGSADSLASVAESISQTALSQIIDLAKSEH